MSDLTVNRLAVTVVQTITFLGTAVVVGVGVVAAVAADRIARWLVG